MERFQGKQAKINEQIMWQVKTTNQRKYVEGRGIDYKWTKKEPQELKGTRLTKKQKNCMEESECREWGEREGEEEDYTAKGILLEIKWRRTHKTTGGKEAL